jgi:hypothetical protein
MDMVTLTREVAATLGNFPGNLPGKTQHDNFFEVSYVDLLCAFERRGCGYLPEDVALFCGLGNCPTKNMVVGTVKSSPSNPATALQNFNDISRWAQEHNKTWYSLLHLQRESSNCEVIRDKISDKTSNGVRAPGRLAPSTKQKISLDDFAFNDDR